MAFPRAMDVLLVLLVCLSNSKAMGFNTVVGNGNASSVKCKENERQALLALKKGFIDKCDRLSSWGSTGQNEKECCKWKGVRCSEKTGHVVMLDLHNLPNYASCFEGTINSSLAELRHLSYLDLSHNLFDMEFPKFIGSLTHLKYLNLSSCFLRKRIPSELGSLFHLQYLDLSGNSLVGEFPIHSLNLQNNQSMGKIPDFFANISSLEYLDLSRNQFSGTIPHSLGNLSHLVHLDLSLNYLKGKISNFLTNISSLQYLDLGYNSLDGSQISLRFNIKWVSHLTSLKTLKLAYVDLSSSNNWQQQISNLSRLQELDLSDCNLVSPMSPIGIHQISGNNLSRPIPKSLLDICSLSVLDLSYNNLSGRLDDYVSTSTDCVYKSLKSLDLTGNQITGSIPHLSQFSALRELFLADNRLNGTVSESIGQLLNLELLYLGNNYLQGVISEAHFSKLSKLTVLDLSFNALEFNISNDWIPPFQLDSILLASCKLGSAFQTWIRTQKEHTQLDISSAGIFDTIPNWFWNLSSSLEELDFSNNQIYGEIPNLSIEYTTFAEVNLSSNMFLGPIPSFLSMTSSLDLSNNEFSKLDSFLCANTTKIVHYLDLSNNQLLGELPECWARFESLAFLDLTNNSLSGKVPTSMGSLAKMQALRMRKNKFIGELPSSMKNCKELIFLDVGQNNFSGSIPTWIGDELPKLVFLILRFNSFFGTLPSKLCQLAKVQLLDLSFNGISGSIPNCLNNLVALAKQTTPSQIIYFTFTENRGGQMSEIRKQQYSASFMWKGKESLFKSTLGLVKSIDLSSNKLSGKIPNEIMDLIGLISLNISRNRISGQIPATIGQLRSLDVLDLSRNHLCGQIPYQISQLGLLGVLDLSYNNLSGEIPIATRLQSVDASAYIGNPELCGIPLPKCLTNQTEDSQNDGNHEDDESFFTQGFYISMAIGFGVGFWGVCSSLFLKKSWRYAYFNFLNDVYDKLYVMVAINKAKLQRWITTTT